MQFIEADPLPKVCQECGERRELLAHGEGEWCCDECDHLAERFIMIPDREIKLKPRKKPNTQTQQAVCHFIDKHKH